MNKSILAVATLAALFAGPALADDQSNRGDEERFRRVSEAYRLDRDDDRNYKERRKDHREQNDDRRRDDHDWDRGRAVTILKRCRQAMPTTGRLLLVEAVIPPGNEPHAGKIMDFVMLTALGGQERTEEQYADLLQEAGFRLSAVVPTASPMTVIEGRPS